MSDSPPSVLNSSTISITEVNLTFPGPRVTFILMSASGFTSRGFSSSLFRSSLSSWSTLLRTGGMLPARWQCVDGFGLLLDFPHFHGSPRFYVRRGVSGSWVWKRQAAQWVSCAPRLLRAWHRLSLVEQRLQRILISHKSSQWPELLMKCWAHSQLSIFSTGKCAP